VVDRGGDLNVVEAAGGEQVAVFGAGEGADGAADAGFGGGAVGVGGAVVGDDVGDAESAARAKDAERLGEDARLVGGQGDDAVPRKRS
jgi:hypothetical protein